ncbi:nitroreductase family protein [uncultured Friedmanniella sp.]|uniref:nitroreductase family protein n=1 Tax=uncultured Friedmanniella sp. TaxID=335381 RepID=UPI0035C976EF
MSVKQKVIQLVPRPVRRGRERVIRVQRTMQELVPAFAYDFRRYLRHSSSTGPYGSKENLRSKITATYHNLEKGLSLSDPRPGFGEQPVGTLVTLLSAYLSAYGYDAWVTTPLLVLRSYRDFNESAGAVTPHHAAITALLLEAEHHLAAQSGAAGVRQVERTQIERAVGTTGLDFFSSRSSVRQYSDVPVDVADIEFAAAAAQRAPAVCNRQYNRVYVHTDKAEIARILEVQGGARGFGTELGGLAIITSDLRNFWAAGERNQAWVDGGLFAMSFVLGLHARGLGTICLNWSKPPSIDRRLREVADLPAEAVVIMLVGFGVLRDSYTVASSNRVPLNEVLELR